MTKDNVLKENEELRETVMVLGEHIQMREPIESAYKSKVVFDSQIV